MPYRKRAGQNADAPGSWQHDKFADANDTEEDAPAAAAAAAASSSSSSSASVTRVLIENIFNVTSEEVKDLFSKDYPSFRDARVNFDRSGRGTGLALISFGDEADADAAVQKYNDAELEGNTLKLHTVDASYRFPSQNAAAAAAADDEGDEDESGPAPRGGRGRGRGRGSFRARGASNLTWSKGGRGGGSGGGRGRGRGRRGHY